MKNSLFSENLKYLRKLYCISQEEMANKIGINRTTYAYLENNSKRIKDMQELRNALFNTFGYTLDELLTTNLKENKTTQKSQKELLLSSIDSRLKEISDELKNLEK